MKLGLLGHPVAHSLSPPMHRAALLFFGIEGTYETFDVEPASLSQRLSELEGAGISGLNVTIPHKEAIFQLAHSKGIYQSLEARIVGAVNTIRFDSSQQFQTHNTDLGGFIRALQHASGSASSPRHLDATNYHYIPSRFDLNNVERLDLDLTLAVVLGAGGAARACLAGLILLGCKKIVIAARRPIEAQSISDFVSSQITSLFGITCSVEVVSFEKLTEHRNSSLLVNCTPIGLTENQTPDWSEALFENAAKSSLFFDTVYSKNGQPTLLMNQAKLHGLSAFDGLQMLVEQAALSFEIWTGRRPDSNLMLNALKPILNC